MTASTTLTAHRSIKATIGPLREQVLEVIDGFGSEGCIGDQVRAVMLSRDMKDGSLNTRYSELEDAGLIFRNGEKRPAATGRMQLVMRHSRWADSTPRVAGPKPKRNPFLEGMKHATKIMLEADSLETAKIYLKRELRKAARRV